MGIAVTPLYAALIAGLFIALSARTIVYRRGARIDLGPGEDPEMLRRMRVHANCAEYAPVGLLLLLMVELQGAPAGLVHALGATLVAGRAIHAWGLSRTPQILAARVAGMVLTFTQIGATALAGLALALI